MKNVNPTKELPGKHIVDEPDALEDIERITSINQLIDNYLMLKGPGVNHY